MGVKWPCDEEERGAKHVVIKLSSYIPRPIRESDESALSLAQTYQLQFYSIKKSECDQQHDTETGDRDSKDDDNPEILERLETAGEESIQMSLSLWAALGVGRGHHDSFENFPAPTQISSEPKLFLL